MDARMKLQARVIVQKIEQAERLAIAGTPEHAAYVKAALMAEWPRLKAFLTAAATP